MDYKKETIIINKPLSMQ